MSGVFQRRRVLRLGGLSVRWRLRGLCALAGLALLVAGLALVLLGTGRLALSPAGVIAALAGEGGDMAARLVWQVRLPRVLTATGVGAALGVSGAVFQALSRNPLGSPDVIGFTTGAASGALAAIILGGAGALAVALGAVGSGLAAAAAVLMLARGGSGYRLVLVGIGVGAVLASLNTLMLLAGDLERAMAAQVWLAGSLAARSWAHVATVAVGLGLLLPVCLAQARGLALLEMGEDMAQGLGVRPARLRAWLVLAAVGLCAVAVAATGPVAFVALAAPRLARRLAGGPGVPLMAAALAGAGLLLAADLLEQAAPHGLFLPIGLTTGLLGGLYLLGLLALRRG